VSFRPGNSLSFSAASHLSPVCLGLTILSRLNLCLSSSRKFPLFQRSESFVPALHRANSIVSTEPTCQAVRPGNSLSFSAASHLSPLCIGLTVLSRLNLCVISSRKLPLFQRIESFVPGLPRANNCTLSLPRAIINQSSSLIIRYYVKLWQVQC
jgi:hypothetical protein